MQRQPVSAIYGILHQLCPRCRDGKIFRRSVWLLPAMHARCPVCGLKFEREAGYFLGAMYVSYGLGLGIIAIFSGIAWKLTKWPIMSSVIAGVVLFLPLVPVVTWMARVLWIYLDQSVDPDLS